MTADPNHTVFRGAQAETLASDYLCAQGYEIIKRNHRCAGGEVDIIAVDQDVLCFIEVRSLACPSHGDPLETIDAKKINRVIKAAWDFVDDLPPPWPMMRFDAVGVVMTEPPQIRLVREAFEDNRPWPSAHSS